MGQLYFCEGARQEEQNRAGFRGCELEEHYR